MTTADSVDWFTHRRLYEYCTDIPQGELETAYYAAHQAHTENVTVLGI